MLPVDILKLMAEHKYLSNTDQFAQGTPTNRIIFKTLPNIGATHGEILLYKWRNSICLQPNVPVLHGKRDAIGENGRSLYPDIFIVCKGVNQKQVENYLKSDIKPKKILCTPEAYMTKVVEAIKSTDYSLYDDFFLLMDECDKLIRDVDYRPKIILPIQDFFKFKNKAMISATAIEPSDKRFAENQFRILKVEPQYDYSTNLNLITTNNVLGSLRKVLESYINSSYFIFVNSTDLIHALIKALKIQGESKVFCAPKSVQKLAKQGFVGAFDKLGMFGKYNFLTSRCFSAVDIKIKDKPHIIMITNVDRAPYTMLDPATDSIQIVGRLRNGIDKVIHITNTNSSIKTFNETELLNNIEDSFEEYSEISKRKDVTITAGGLNTINQALDGTEISLLVGDNGRLNTYMVDNALLENRVRKLYQNDKNLVRAYENLMNFKMKHHLLNFDISDDNLIGLEQKHNNRLLCEHVAAILNIHDNPVSHDGQLRFYLSEDIKKLREENIEVAILYDTLGYDEMNKYGFCANKMKRAMHRLTKTNDLLSESLKIDMHKLYVLPVTISEEELKVDGQNVFTDHRMKKRFAAADILRFFEAHRTTDILKFKVWKLKRAI